MTGNHIGNRREALGWLAGGGVAATALVVVDPSFGDDKKEVDVALAKVPKVVMEAAERVLPKATWLFATKVVDGKKTAYEIDGTDGKDREVTLLITAAGKVVEVETQLKGPARVPAKVLAAVKEKWPAFDPTETHEIRQGQNLQGPKDGDYLYDMRGTIAKGREIQVQVSADGEILESVVEVPINKVPAVVMAALTKARPKFEVGTPYAISEKETVIGYHFEGKGPKGRELTISVTPDGKQVEVVE